MSSCIPLEIGDKCDKCGKGTMRPTGKRFILHEKIGDSYKPTQELIELQCDNCGHKHINIKLSEYISSKDKVEVTK